MKTNLNRVITSEAEAKEFLLELIVNNEIYNPDDDARLVAWETCNPSQMEKGLLNICMKEVWQFLPDPHAFLLENDK